MLEIKIKQMSTNSCLLEVRNGKDKSAAKIIHLGEEALLRNDTAPLKVILDYMVKSFGGLDPYVAEQVEQSGENLSDVQLSPILQN